MIYISAQPDDFYFTWQLEILLQNLANLKVSNENIHILVAYNPTHGLKSAFTEFIHNNNHLAKFYTYPDNREETQYKSSVRPHILLTHFKAFPWLKESVIFYHDSDLLFSKVPEIEHLYSNDVCYVSDTRNYLDSKYILSNGSEDLLLEMAKIVGIDTKTIFDNDENTGGAQYILKNIDEKFWEKVEKDSERLFVLMSNYNKDRWVEKFRQDGTLRSQENGIQAWCADMWALLWNLWYFEKEVKIHSQMNFSWPETPIKKWKENPILHYSGHQGGGRKTFAKTVYVDFPPWYDEGLSSIPSTNCSFPLVQAIVSKRKELDKTRTSLMGVCFLLIVENLDSNSVELIKLTKRYLQKYLACDIKVLVIDQNYTVYSSLITEVEVIYNNFQYFKLKDFGFNNFVFLPVSYLLGNTDFIQITNFLLKKENKGIYHIQPSHYFNIDQIFTRAFSFVLDDQLFSINLNKFMKVKNDARIVFIDSDSLFDLKVSVDFSFHDLLKVLTELAKPLGTAKLFKLSILSKINDTHD